MTQAMTQLPANSPHDAVSKALDDPATRDGLFDHALAILGKYLVHRPSTDRLDKAKEACQEAYARALQKSHEYDSARPVRPWLHGIMNNILAEMTRGLRRSPVQEPPDRAAWEHLAVDLVSDVTEVANRLDVDGYLAKLSPEHREIVKLRFHDGLSHENLAARIGISVGNARVRLCRAVNALKKIAGVIPEEKRP